MIVLKREVTATRQEFLHGLRLAFADGIDVRGDEIRVGYGNVTLQLQLADMPPLRIGALALSRLRVGIRVDGGNDENQRALLARMDRAMQRGGG